MYIVLLSFGSLMVVLALGMLVTCRVFGGMAPPAVAEAGWLSRLELAFLLAFCTGVGTIAAGLFVLGPAAAGLAWLLEGREWQGTLAGTAMCLLALLLHFCLVVYYVSSSADRPAAARPNLFSITLFVALMQACAFLLALVLFSLQFTLPALAAG